MRVTMNRTKLKKLTVGTKLLFLGKQFDDLETQTVYCI